MPKSYEEENIQVQRYVDREMTTQERSEFEAEMEKNPALLEAVAFEEKLLQLGGSANDKIKNFYEGGEKNEEEDKDVLAMIAGARKSWEKENKDYLAKGMPIVAKDADKPAGLVKKMYPWKSWTVAAAVLAILITCITMILIYKKEPSPIVIKPKEENKPAKIIPPDTAVNKRKTQENVADHKEKKNKPADKLKKYSINADKSQELYANNFKPDAVPEQTDASIKPAMDDYADGRYKDAVVNFETESRGFDPNKKLTDFYRHYYKGLSFLADSKAEKAIPEFETAINKSTSPLLKSKSQWYLALSYLKTAQAEKCGLLLNELSKTGAGEYKAKAAELIQQLK